MTPREGETCDLCGFPVAETGSGLCQQCTDFQQPAAAASAAAKYSASADGCRNCGSHDTELRRKIAANGSVMFAYQCLECGRAASQWLKREVVGDPSALGEWDSALSEVRFSELSEARQQAIEQRMQERRAEYSAYRKTEKWKAIRSRVLSRSRGMCEGCGISPADDIHHLTYQNLGDEFLFQLVALCRPCHDRLHNAQRSAA